ncbi:hypothetical protein HOLleu_25341 [Holothuria leucospilota]|uniref:IgGFc-binding protein N-terminal domain-containing protein n=1 Tax=Holothuria leucospilota TaxID=206669 RepID=A0A9Q1H1T0_HOLLE|nr:hypothetical protein HOLleu_25341 [Holothuria leucospilota]
MGKYDAYCLGGKYDTTGTHISANKPIFVLSGSFSEKLNEFTGRDVFYESLTPTTIWGNHFSLVPLNVRTPGFVRILSSMENTMVNIFFSNHSLTQNYSLDRGESHDVLLFGDTNEIVEIVSTKPLLVAQFTSQSNDFEWTDPSMVLVPSHLQNTKNDIMFPVFTFPSDEQLLSYVTVWCNGDTSELTLDNSPNTNWTVIGVDNFGSVIVRAFLLPGSHILQTNTDIRAVVNVAKKFMSYSFPLP